MAATTVDGNKVDDVVKSNVDEVVKSNVDEVVKSNVDEVVKSNADEVVVEKSNVGAVEKSKVVTLKSSDGERFEITNEAAALSQTLQHMIEDGCTENDIPLPNVRAPILAMVVEYCKKHAAAAAAAAAAGFSPGDNTAAYVQQELKSFDAEFIKKDQPTLFEIILAANYLNIKELLDLSCQTVAHIIKDYTPEQIRDFFKIENDFTPQEEADVREENKWAFE